MLLGIQSLRAIVVLPFLSYGFAILVALSVLFPGGRDDYLIWAVFLGAVIIAAAGTRVLRRTGEWIEILSLRGRTRILAKEYLLHFEISVVGRFSSMQWQLACEKHPQQSVNLGFLLLGTIRGIKRARKVLGLPISFETEMTLNAAERAGVGSATLIWKVLIVLVVPFAIVLAWNIVKSLHEPRGDLVIQCAKDQHLRLSGGWGTATGWIGIAMAPGDYNVDLWIPQRRCWAQRRVTIVVGKTTSVPCEDLARAVECIPGEPPLPNYYQRGQGRLPHNLP